MPPALRLPVLLGLALLAAGGARAACPPGSGTRLVLAAPQAPGAQALLGPALAAGPGTLPVVLAQVNGVALPFVLDTGSGLTQIRPDAAAALALPIDPGRSTPITGIGGTSRFPNALLREFALGGRAWAGVSVPVSPGGEDRGRIAGIVGADLLRGGALEMDLPAGRMALHDSPACLAAPPAWPEAEALPVEITPEGLPVVVVRVNGRPARALLDTGAAQTVLRQDRIAGFGIPDSALRAPPAGTVYGTGAAETAFYLHEGSTVALGGGERLALPLVLAPLPPGLPVDLVLGQDVLAPRRLWLSYPARRLVVAPGARERSGTPAARERTGTPVARERAGTPAAREGSGTPAGRGAARSAER